MTDDYGSLFHQSSHCIGGYKIVDFRPGKIMDRVPSLHYPALRRALAEGRNGISQSLEWDGHIAKDRQDHQTSPQYRALG